MKRAVSILCVLSLLFILLAACGGEKELDTSAFFAEAIDSGAFDMQLEQIDSETALYLYLLDEENVAQCISYAYPGATSEELTVFTCLDEAAAEAVAVSAGEYLARRYDSFASYLPAEAEKLDGAEPVIYGKYVVVAVVADKAAFGTVANKYLK